MTSPSIHNLRKRAKTLGFAITKISDGTWGPGHSEYVLHRIGADYSHCTILSLYGIRALIEKREAAYNAS